MSDIADRFVVILDANVLYPFRVRDTLLRFAEAGLFRAHWSPTIMVGWTRNLLDKRPDMEPSIRSQITAMERAFPESCVSGAESLIIVLAGASLNLQSHYHRSEHWIIVEGTAKVTLNGDIAALTENQSIYIPVGAQHRIEDPGHIPMVSKCGPVLISARITSSVTMTAMQGHDYGRGV